MPLGVIEIREVREDQRTVKQRFISGTDFNVTDASLRRTGWGALAIEDIGKGLDVEYELRNGKPVDIRRYAVIPESVRKILAAYGCDHSGLALDKFVYRSADQSFVKQALQTVVAVNNGKESPALCYSRLRQRRLDVLSATSTELVSASTTGPLTLHLSRASALENAGICLHPLYGFAYLPGSGLKGMARAYAETVWLPAQLDKIQAWRQIEDVFGWVPNPDRKRQINNPDHPARLRRVDDDDQKSPVIQSHVGNIVFHDAWPETWAALFVDIVNNHHPDYYQHDDNDHPPGDWEDPKPVYFLAVKPDTKFTFALAKRRDDVRDDSLALACQWLLGALCHSGAGAKTNAGYGAFKPAGDLNTSQIAEVASTWNAALTKHHRAEFSTTLELVTPAFLAGADQQAEDCDLRPATLRGQLRWWWRTMHAGFMDVKTLRALESAIWGDMREGGAVRIVIESVGLPAAQPYNKESKVRFSKQEKQSAHGLPDSDPNKTTQGLWYLSFGMDETSKGQRKQRFYLEPKPGWNLKLIARPTRFFPKRADVSDPKKTNQGKPITAEQVLSQAKTATYLFCRFGAVGSKARKGFGSLTAENLDDWESDKCKETAKQLRQSLELSNEFNEGFALSPSLHQMLDPVEVTFSWPNVWSVLDQVGFAYQAFAKKYKHRLEKKALGLPRRVDHPTQGSFNPTPPVTANSRHSSPIHIHIDRINDSWLVRAVAFPAAHLPNLSTSQAFLEEFLRDFGDDLRRRAALPPPSSDPGQSTRVSHQPVQRATRSGHPKPGDHVEAVLLEEKTRKGGWKAKYEGLSGPIQNTTDVPADKQAGETLKLIVASVTQRQIDFRYPTRGDEERAQQATRNSKRKHGGARRSGPRT